MGEPIGFQKNFVFSTLTMANWMAKASRHRRDELHHRLRPVRARVDGNYCYFLGLGVRQSSGYRQNRSPDYRREICPSRLCEGLALPCDNLPRRSTRSYLKLCGLTLGLKNGVAADQNFFHWFADKCTPS